MAIVRARIVDQRVWFDAVDIINVFDEMVSKNINPWGIAHARKDLESLLKRTESDL